MIISTSAPDMSKSCHSANGSKAYLQHNTSTDLLCLEKDTSAFARQCRGLKK